ncbi:branched-chain amino acid transport system II carrier protein [Clostridium senegalense]|uniref:Branched-chain amino acid transport system carrier protein n=1 Tax=Clostridium senegalense TaxID=1465809 RepID=A0A6M0H501_9CLOT|nr:branched-chain amino acid transport system II carrier protein [Clostridium senegalense]NEU05153.1 branched-chain amino acid transport system II carrier protein [Clostridium senegalense]
MKKIFKQDFIVIGFALFAMFFGAGNLIFPPYIGNLVGNKVPLAIIGFLITGVGLPLSGIIACAKINGSFSDISSRCGKVFSIITTTALVLSIGPMLAIPRTGATTYELAVKPIFPSVNSYVVLIVYFSISLAFVLKPSKIVDNIGKFLTPLLLLILAIIIIKGLIFPIGSIVNTNFKNTLSYSLLEGYQTMDGMGSVIMASIVLTGVRLKGYTKKEDILKVTIKSALVAIIGLGLVYGGLMILGSQSSTIISKDIGRSALIIEIVNKDLGSLGSIFLALAVALACLTTSIGLTSTAAQYFNKLSKDKISYNTFSILISITSIFLGSGGVEKIVNFAIPILQILYPIVIILILITLAGKYVSNNKTVKITVYTCLVMSILDTINKLTNHSITFINNFIKIIPLSNVGFSWIIPSLIAFVIGMFLFKKDLSSKINI